MPRLVSFALVLVLFVAAGCSSTAPAVEPAPPVSTETPVEEPTPQPAAPASPVEEAPIPLEGDALNGWHLLDATGDPVHGASVEPAYAEFLVGRTPRDTVVVAVIDSGVDIEHEDLQGAIWANTDEVPGNGVDDDANGYVDDVHGWNFIGGPEGENVDEDTFEVTREYARLRGRYEGMAPSEVPAEDQEEYAYFQDVRERFQARRAEFEAYLVQLDQINMALQASTAALAEELGPKFTVEQVRKLETADPQLAQLRDLYLQLDEFGIDAETVESEREQLQSYLEYGLNPEFDPRGIVGDDYTDGTEIGYGNNDVEGPDATHGTHVAGIIAMQRGNGLGGDGVAAPVVQIMSVRAVPNGDERDKDVANAIRYAVDNGARVVNMSFGKDLSPQRELVEAAIRYAEEQGVLLVHAAGNDAEDIDQIENFPTRYYPEGYGAREASTWLEVGAVGPSPGAEVVGPFSNYGQRGVDLFAPGVEIYSTVPDNEYDRLDGTSMAAPIVSGVAALVLAYYPDLTASDVAGLLSRTVTPLSDLDVVLPGSGAEPGRPQEEVLFGTLSRTGGVVNALEALRAAETME